MTTEIKLRNGMIAIIDESDFALVSKFAWGVVRAKCGNVYARSETGATFKGKRFFMHNLIMGFKGADHANRNGLDNRRANLRQATQTQNRANSRKSIGKSSKFKGVAFDRFRNKWRSYIKKDRKNYYIGRFESEIDAAKAYDKKAIEFFGEFALPNFKQAA